MSSDQDGRIQSEISLLEAMYPEQVSFDTAAREVKYSTKDYSFSLRLPSGYLVDELPEIISANIRRIDARQQLKDTITACNPGEEVLDSIISKFIESAELQLMKEEMSRDESSNQGNLRSASGNEKATVIVWLHHLLNTNKRKQALSPASEEVSGITKPGYPGVLLYSGPATGVYKQVGELRQLNWQAFSVRLESDDAWTFQHGLGVKEFETMKEVVADIETDENKEQFMEAMRMK